MTTNTATGIEPLVVRPNEAMRLLGCRRNFLYNLINAGELESYRDGNVRMITVRGIHALIERKLRETAAINADGREKKRQAGRKSAERRLESQLQTA
jgi:excisionase family DNA binding protein